MGGLCIVAIPREDDHVYKVSSEKVPHLTLLFLGEMNDGVDLKHIVEYVQHTTETSAHRFGLSVDRRGVLGDKNADVLFFGKDWSRDIAEFRNLLLKDPKIKELFDMSEQYPEWTPHLTLGFPETPAKPDERDYPINWVEFDRIAVWMGDYEGPEFRLESNDRGLTMSDAEQFLAHYGVKGMKWGHRKSTDITDVTIDAKPGQRVKAKGGENQPASEDAKRAATSKQKAKASTTDALSNKELQDLVNRMNLEQNYRRLTQTDSSAKRAQKAVKELLGVGKTYNEVIQFQNSPAGQQLKEKLASK